MVKGRYLALLLVVCMGLSMISGCGNSEEPASNSVGDSVGTEKPDDGSLDDEDMAEINVMYISMGNATTGLQDVEDAINEITETEINTHVNLEMVEAGSYDQQVSLRLAGNEKTDLMVTFPEGASSFASMTALNQLYPITDLLDEYGSGIINTVGQDVLNATTINGETYAVTTWRSLVTSVYICMRTDMLEEQGLLEKAQSMTSFDEYEEILEVIKNNYSMAPMAGSINGVTLQLAGTNLLGDFADCEVYETHGDTLRLVAMDYGTTEMYNHYASEEYKAMLEKVTEWYEKGYVYKDSMTTEDSGETLVKNNATFSFIQNSEIGVETAKAAACGYDMTCVKVITMPIDTLSCTKFTWAVPTSATEPEAAVKFLNLMYTDERIANLLSWGVEDLHYQVVDGVATYIEGQDVSSCEYHSSDFLFGNQFLVKPWEGQSADFRDQAMAEMESGGKSEFLGFSMDTSTLTNELTAVNNVIQEYRPGLECGASGMGVYEEFLEKLETAGASKVIDEYQRQFDEWKAQQ